MASSNMLVAAIDFGTTYSGAAMSFCHEYERDPTKVFAIKVGNPRTSLKCMTCILIKPDGRSYFKFGEDADSHYNEELDESERKNWYYFKQFKMQLYNLKGGGIKDFKLIDQTGKSLPALRVFSLAIRFLKDKVLESCNERLLGVMDADEISWVLTVPAIWDDRAKGFMREAAEDAGIQRKRLVIALEPEAASIFCQHIPLVRDQPELSKLVPFKTGMKYVVLDCGGGTVDITVHEVTDKVIESKHSSITTHYVKEIDKARGNDMGGTKVDQAFFEYLASIVGQDVFEQYQKQKPDDFWELINSFEEKKRKVEVDGLNMTISTKLMKVFTTEKGSELQEHLESVGNTDITFPAKGKMRINNDAAIVFFSESISSIISTLHSLFEQANVTDCSTMLLVGGYSESKLLQQRIKDAFPSKTVLCPNEAGLAVLKGAVIFGHNPKAISERISRFTYGTDILGKLFSKLVEIGDRLEVGKANRVETYIPHLAEQTSVSIDIYISPNRNPILLSEEGCVKIMPRTFPIPDTTGGRNREVEVCMIFGGTEFSVNVKDLTTGHEETFFVSSWD